MISIMLVLFGGGILAWLSQGWDKNWPRWFAIASCLISGLLLLPFFVGAETFALRLGDSTSPWLSFTQVQWIPRFGIEFIFAVDGLSLIMVALTLFLGFVAVISSWHEISQRSGFFHFNLLWTLAGVVGVFTSFDLFLFFFFWEVMLIPMYFLIAIWGHENRSYAAMKFFLFTQVSGLLLLIAILGLVLSNAQATGVMTFNYFELLNHQLPQQLSFWLMCGFFIAFVVKLPGFPFHTWLPDAHTQAPTAASVLLAGILLKTGAYGLLRFTVPLFPEAAASFATVAMTLGAIGIVYGAILAFAQTDFKRLVAYSSVSHMGFVLVGIFAWNQLALQGAVMQMIAHGFSTAALFMLAGALQHRLHSRDMTSMGGLWQSMPRMGATALFFIVASLGMPGLGNFIGEFLILLGLFHVNTGLAVFAALGLIGGAIYALIAMQRVFQGPAKSNVQYQDFAGLEMLVMVVMMLALVLLGVYPQPVFDLLEPVLAGLYKVAGDASIAWIGALP